MPHDVRPKTETDSLSDHIEQNIESVVALQRRDWEQTSVSQRRAERIGRFLGRPAYLVGVLCIAALWVAANVVMPHLGYAPIDPFPFELLQGMMTLCALITTTIVLIAQNRQTKLEQQHTHLGLQVNLLTEQKVTKLIHLIEELRHDLPMVRDRLDPQAEALQERADTHRVLSAIEERGLTDGGVTTDPDPDVEPDPDVKPDADVKADSAPNEGGR
jgi:uncharacterized membrane protein